MGVSHLRRSFSDPEALSSRAPKPSLRILGNMRPAYELHPACMYGRMAMLEDIALENAVSVASVLLLTEATPRCRRRRTRNCIRRRSSRA